MNRWLDAVRREVREETGLESRAGAACSKSSSASCATRRRAEYHYVLIDYICRVTGGTLPAGDDVARVEWVRRGDLATLQITEGTLGGDREGLSPA